MGNPIKIDDLGVPLFLETPIYPKQPVIFSLLNLGNPPAKRMDAARFNPLQRPRQSQGPT